jgi:hypothetical protein
MGIDNSGGGYDWEELLLTLQPLVGFGLLHQFIPSPSVFDEIFLVLHF